MYEITNRSAEPYRTVCYIVCSWSDGTRTSGSGVVVGVNDVLTAMHVVYDAMRGGWATQITISPAADTIPLNHRQAVAQFLDAERPARQRRGVVRAAQRRRDHRGDAAASAQVGRRGLGLAPAQFGQRGIAAAGIPALHRQFGLTVTQQQ